MYSFTLSKICVVVSEQKKYRGSSFKIECMSG